MEMCEKRRNFWNGEEIGRKCEELGLDENFTENGNSTL